MLIIMTRRMEEMRRGGEAGGQVWWIQEQIGWLVGWFIPEEHAERVVFQPTLLNKVYFRIWVQNFDPQILARKALGSKFWHGRSLTLKIDCYEVEKIIFQFLLCPLSAVSMSVVFVNSSPVPVYVTHSLPERARVSL